MDKTDFDGIQTKVLIQHYLMFYGPKEPCIGHLNIKGPQTRPLYLSQLRKIFVCKRKKLHWFKLPDKQLLGQEAN